MTTAAYPDAAGGTVDWLRGLSAVTALVASSSIDLGTTGTLPEIVVTRIGGGDDEGEAPLDQPLLQIDCWADTHSAAFQIAATIRAALTDLRTPTAFGAGVTALGGSVADMVWQPDPEADTPRYVLTAQLTIRSNP